MPTLQQIEEEVKQLSHTDQKALRDWLENLIEDQLELREDFKAEIQAGIRDMKTL